MTMRTVGAWAGLVLAAGSLTGCAGSGANSNFQRPTSSTVPTARVTPPTAMPTSTAPANSSPWAQQPITAPTKPAGDPSALVAPTGSAPPFGNQPSGGINPIGGIAPAAPLPSAAPVPAAPAPGSTTSNLIPLGQSINSLNAGSPLSLTPTPGRQVAVNAVRTTDNGPRAIPVPAGPNADEPVAGPIMPPASAGSESLQPPPPITQLSPVMLGTPPPTTVRQ